ncbi:hypothetical protein GCM10011504_51720 [Siccirubricoccus deserti]|nr:hypothetical protein GCM10011504_51720 [Siccirubricoccus deserti]
MGISFEFDTKEGKSRLKVPGEGSSLRLTISASLQTACTLVVAGRQAADFATLHGGMAATARLRPLSEKTSRVTALPECRSWHRPRS